LVSRFQTQFPGKEPGLRLVQHKVDEM
jgi:hypothetical protein